MRDAQFAEIMNSAMLSHNGCPFCREHTEEKTDHNCCGKNLCIGKCVTCRAQQMCVSDGRGCPICRPLAEDNAQKCCGKGLCIGKCVTCRAQQMCVSDRRGCPICRPLAEKKTEYKCCGNAHCIGRCVVCKNIELCRLTHDGCPVCMQVPEKKEEEISEVKSCGNDKCNGNNVSPCCKNK